MQFFHWELEFPDVFIEDGSGFSSIIGNPPWETLKPNSAEFFGRYNSIFRTLKKQDALSFMKELFALSPRVETDWLSIWIRLHLFRISSVPGWIHLVSERTQ